MTTGCDSLGKKESGCRRNVLGRFRALEIQPGSEGGGERVQEPKDPVYPGHPKPLTTIG